MRPQIHVDTTYRIIYWNIESFSRYLIASKALERVNHSTVAMLINDNINAFFKDISIAGRVCDFISDPSNLIRSCCLPHCWGNPKWASRLISAVKNMFLKTLLLIQLYREQFCHLQHIRKILSLHDGVLDLQVHCSTVKII